MPIVVPAHVDVVSCLTFGVVEGNQILFSGSYDKTLKAVDVAVCESQVFCIV